MRALFVNENIGGNATMHLHLRQALLRDHPDIDASFFDVPPRGIARKVLGAAVPGLARLDLDLAATRGHVSLSALVRRRLDTWPDPFDVLHVYTHNAALLSVRHLRRHPSVVGLDATTAQSARLLPYRDPTRFTPTAIRPSQALERRVYDAADVIVAKSSWARASLVDEYGVDPAKIRTIPYGIEMPPAPEVERRPDQIAFVGRSMARKGGWLLLDVWRRHLRSDHRLVLVTPEDVAPEPGLTVLRDLRTGDPRLLEVLASSAVLAFPSTGDTFGYALLEAMSVGTPAVAFAAAAVPEIIDHGRTGLLVEPGDTDGLAAALPSVTVAMGDAARHDVRARFDAAVTTAQLVALLREVQR
jgi:glycosyltransferase involved in cell wall biosynthesis